MFNFYTRSVKRKGEQATLIDLKDQSPTLAKPCVISLLCRFEEDQCVALLPLSEKKSQNCVNDSIDNNQKTEESVD